MDFTASINSAKKIITIKPVQKLITGTRYYVILADEALETAGGEKNDGASAYFTTRGNPPDPAYSVAPDTQAIATIK